MRRTKSVVPTRIRPGRLNLEWQSMPRSATLHRDHYGNLTWWDVLSPREDGELYEVRITYPLSFPFERPRAYVDTPEIAAFAPHRYLDGGLCLFPTSIDPDMSCTAGVIRNRAALWLFVYENWLETGSWSAPQIAH